MTDINTTDNTQSITKQLVNKPIKFVTPTRTVKVLDIPTNSVIWEGQTNETKQQLKIKYGSNVTVKYSVLYTTVNAVQTYDEALQDPKQVSHWAYSLDEFENWLATLDKDIDYTYIAYNNVNLNKQKAEAVNNTKASLSLYFYTSLHSGLVNGKFPIKGVTNYQATIAKQSLMLEDEARIDFIKQCNYNPSEDDVKDVQIESVLFLTGSPQLISWYIQSTNLQWITGTSNDRKGLIHNTTKGNYQVTMLLLDVTLERNKEVMKQVGWL